MTKIDSSNGDFRAESAETPDLEAEAREPRIGERHDRGAYIDELIAFESYHRIELEP